MGLGALVELYHNVRDSIKDHREYTPSLYIQITILFLGKYRFLHNHIEHKIKRRGKKTEVYT
jgi:hypothetical protein